IAQRFVLRDGSRIVGEALQPHMALYAMRAGDGTNEDFFIVFHSHSIRVIPENFCFVLAIAGTNKNLSGTQSDFPLVLNLLQCPSFTADWVPDKLSFVLLTQAEKKVFRDDETVRPVPQQPELLRQAFR